MKTQGKHLLGLLFVLALFALLLSASAFADGDPAYSFDAATHTLTLTGGDYDKDHNWGSDFTKSEVWHVTAQTGVRFVGDCRQLFKNFSSCTDIDLRNVDVSGMTYAWQMFTGAQYSLTSLNVAGWDVSGLKNMNGMFSYLSRLTTLDLSSWNVSGVTGMESMFNGCSRLTSLNTTGWDVSHVTTMRNMFSSCSGLTDLDLSHWDVSRVTTVEYMFYYCSSLSNLNVANWNVSSVTSMYDMFQNCASLTTLDLSSWNVSKVTSMAGMFDGCSRLAALNITGWDASALEYASYLFRGCRSLTALDLSGWNLYNISPWYETEMFANMPNLSRLTLPAPREGSEQYPDQPNWYLNNGANGEGWIIEGTTQIVSGSGTYAVIPAPAQATTYVWNPLGPRFSYDSGTKALTLNYGTYDKDETWGSVAKTSVKSVTAQSGVRFVGDCSGLFYNFSACETMDLSLVDTSGMTSAKGMFANCIALTAPNIAGWNTAQVTDMSFMFQDCEELPGLDLSAWNTSAVTSMEYMFDGCKSLATLNAARWDTSSVTTMEALFQNCYELTALDLSRWDTSAVTTMANMFYSVCNELTELDLSAWDVSHVTAMDYMFAECYSLETLTLPTGNVSGLTTIQGMFKACYRLTALDLSGFTVSQDTVADDLFLYADSLAELTLPAGVGVGDFMCLNNGDWYDGPPGWIVRGDATMTTVSGNGGYGDDAVIAPAAQTTTYIWKSEVFGELPALHLPGGTLSVAESAFENCGAWIVYVNDGCTAIGPGAFQNCARLQVIHIPASVTEIDATAFDGCHADLWIYGEEESAAEEFCFTNDLHFRPEIVLE